MKSLLSKTRGGRVILIVVIALLVAGIIGWSLRKPAAPTLATSPVMRGDLEQTVEATGVIDAYKLVSVGAQVSGQIKSLKVQLGDVVKQGDLIAEIDSVTQNNSLKNAEAALENVRAQRAVQVATLRESELSFQRQKEMLAAEATSRAEYDAADARQASTRAQIRALDAQIKQRETDLSTAKANLGYTRITAPINGTVVAVVAEEGRTVNANQSAPTIVKLARLDLVTVNAEISEADVVKIKSGIPVYFTILGAPEKKYHATLRTVNPAPASIASDTSSSSSSSSSSTAVYYNALFDVENPDGTLRINMTAQVTVLLSQAKDALIIPSVALGQRLGEGRSGRAAAAQGPRNGATPRGEAGTRGGERREGGRPEGSSGAQAADANVYTVQIVGKEGVPEPRRVRIGINNGANAQVLEGLEEGDRVVVGEGGGPSAGGNRSNQMRMGAPMMGPRR